MKKYLIYLKSITLISIVATGMSLSSFSTADTKTTSHPIEEILSMKHRNDQDRARDQNRDPVNAIDFMGLEPDMKVVEYGPGAGWYTKLLAPYLKNKGELFVAANTRYLETLQPLLKKRVMGKVNVIEVDAHWLPEEHREELTSLDYGITDADMVLNIRMYHSYNQIGKSVLNKAAFQALKPGGKYIVIDHTRRHMAPETNELNRREDPVDVILDIQNVGFELEKYSNMFYRADDELIYEVGRKTVTGNTDRFFFVFKKPENLSL